MTTTYRDACQSTRRAQRGTGSIRERSPGVWEIRVVVGFDRIRGRSIQRSFTVHGDAGFAQRRRRELVQDFGVIRVDDAVWAARISVGELLRTWFEAPHGWRPATIVSHRPVVHALVADRLAKHQLIEFAASDAHVAIRRWQDGGVSVATVSARWLILRSALSWAVGHGLLRANPLTGIKGPPRPTPRRHHTIDEVRLLLRTAEARVTSLEAELVQDPGSARLRRLLFSAEQAQLLVQLAADSGARRGELAVLRRSDLHGRVLTIERGLSHGVIGPTKSGRTRRLTLGSTTVTLIDRQFAGWSLRGPGADEDWLFAPTPRRSVHVTADTLSHKFRSLGRAAGVDQPALHRLRHGVATLLVGEGQLLKAQARLGHRDPSTTLRHYSHATPLDDLDVADRLDEAYRGPR